MTSDSLKVRCVEHLNGVLFLNRLQLRFDKRHVELHVRSCWLLGTQPDVEVKGDSTLHIVTHHVEVAVGERLPDGPIVCCSTVMLHWPQW